MSRRTDRRSLGAGLALIGMLSIAAASTDAQRSTTSPTQADPNCPDSSDTPSTLGQYVGVAFRALSSDPSRPLPPSCLLVAVSQSPAIPSAVFAQTLTLADAWLKLHPGDPIVLEAKLILYSRSLRYSEIPSAFEQFIAADSQRATLNAYRMVIGSAQRAADTAAMVHYLEVATARFPAAASMAAELAVLRQVARLRALIDTVRRAMKADPARIDGYASLTSIYGSLGQSDSAIAYARVALQHGVSRASLGPSLRSLVGSLLRRAQLQSAPDVWEETLTVASAVDSTLSTSETKYLVAIASTEVVGYRFRLLRVKQPAIPVDLRPEVCPNIPGLLALVARATERLASGGDKFSPETVPAIRAQLLDLRSFWLDPIHQICIAK
jgi:hypothetical protein